MIKICGPINDIRRQLVQRSLQITTVLLILRHDFSHCRQCTFFTFQLWLSCCIRFKQSCMTLAIQNNWLIKQTKSTMNAQRNVENVYRNLYHHIMAYALWCLMPLSTIFQLYRDGPLGYHVRITWHAAAVVVIIE
jgi:hypothetical protein